jgi:ornithine cyclodeaminase/alanine dehydrogenase-like protein (mu-crystallin family)
MEMASVSEICLLNAATVRELLPLDVCVPLMRRAFSMVATGETVQPVRQALPLPDRRGLVGWMPGYTADPAWLGVKVVSVFPGNFGTELGSHQGVVLLFETTNGAPVAILDGREITAIRTAAATAVATDVLASPQATSLGLFGYGEQAESHVEALLLVRPFSEILVWGRDSSRSKEFAAAMQARHGCQIEAVVDPRAAAACDVVCTLTAAAEPILEGAWLRPGQHVNIVGSSIPTTSEVDDATIVAGRLFVDFKENALALGGDFRRAKAKGLVDDDHIVGTIGDVITGGVPARLSATDITVFKSLGMSSEDILSADHVLKEARRLGKGQWVEW